VGSGIRTDVTAPAVHEVFNELQRMRDTSVSDDELQTARDAFARSLPGEFETTAQSVGSIAQIYVYGLPLDYYSTLPASINQVTVAEVRRVARQYLQPDKMTVVAVGDRAKIMPALVELKLGPVELRDFNGKALPAAH
jgi:zinc protease